jgi:hypothetical protein
MEEMNLKAMRSQFATPKEPLGEQEIVNDRPIRETIMVKYKVISDVKVTEYTSAMIAFPLVLILYFAHWTSQAFVLATYLLVVFDVISTYNTHKFVDRLNFMEDDLVTVAHTMEEFKKKFNSEFIKSILICILWGAWFFYEFWKHGNTFSSPALLGGIIGLISEFRNQRKAENAAQEIIDEIERNR